jgi:hypothetical protein
MLRDLLVRAIDECAAWVGRDPNRGTGIDSALWVTAGQRAGGAADCREWGKGYRTGCACRALVCWVA